VNEAKPPTAPVDTLYVHVNVIEGAMPDPEYAGIVELGEAAPQLPPVTLAVPVTPAVGGRGLSPTPVIGDEA
jgi:hypothetical protein